MKFSQHFVFGATLVLAASAWAQTPANPDSTSAQAAQTEAAIAEASPSPAPTAAVEPASLIPPNLLPAPDPGSLEPPNAPELEQLKALFKQTTLGKTADEHRLHVQMSALQVRIRNDEGLHALKANAFQAPTDLERRHRLKIYYQAYYGKLRALAGTPDLRDYLKAREAIHELALLQPRTRHETDEAEAAALLQAAVGTTAAALPHPSQAPVYDVLPNN